MTASGWAEIKQSGSAAEQDADNSAWLGLVTDRQTQQRTQNN